MSPEVHRDTSCFALGKDGYILQALQLQENTGNITRGLRTNSHLEPDLQGKTSRELTSTERSRKSTVQRVIHEVGDWYSAGIESEPSNRRHFLGPRPQKDDPSGRGCFVVQRTQPALGSDHVGCGDQRKPRRCRGPLYPCRCSVTISHLHMRRFTSSSESKYQFCMCQRSRGREGHLRLGLTFATRR